MSGDVCGDNRFEIIEKYKQRLIEGTNIASRPEEMAVLDSILFRFWQMGWLEDVELKKVELDTAYECGKNANKWIPTKTRPLTKEEKEHYADLGYSEDSIDFMYDCPLPHDAEEVLVTTKQGYVTTDTFYKDDGCYFETYCDVDDVVAWMPLPEPYKKGGTE
jgi:hypothetical protein